MLKTPQLLDVAARLLTHQQHPTIAFCSLDGFAEDSNAARLFERRFQPLILGGVATAFVGFGVFGWLAFRAQAREDESSLATFTPLALASFLIGVCVCFVAYRRMVKAIPISPRSGQPMEIYQLEDTIKAGKYELIYVCRKSRTYFRRVFTERGGA